MFADDEGVKSGLIVVPVGYGKIEIGVAVTTIIRKKASMRVKSRRIKK